MPLSANGLHKLMEECGELIQIAAKKAVYPHTDEHPDGKENMRVRLAEEIADVFAIIVFISERFDLDDALIEERWQRKHELFMQWDQERDD